jgi:tetratricopeptide (TPR) repeat protein
MEQLDLKKHDSDQFVGKLVSIKNAQYVIGEHLGTGAEKIVHKLFNTRSGICLHVIKLWHFPEQAMFFGKDGRAEVLARLRREPQFRKMIPVSIFVEGHGGYFEIQTSVDGYERVKPPDGISELMSAADQLMEKGEYAAARSSYAQALNIDGSHTVALHNLAVSHSQLGNYKEAANIENAAVEIEPNFIPYRLAQIKFQGAAGNLMVALSSYEGFKSDFPYIHDADEMAIELNLLTGRPEKAEAILSERMIGDEKIAELEKEVANALSQKAQAAALAAQAKNLLRAEQRDHAAVHRLLEKAHQIYDKDIFITFNLGLAQGRIGNYEAAWKMLMSVMSLIPFQYHCSCTANIAFNLIKESDFARSMTLLELTMQGLQMFTKVFGKEINRFDLPGVAIWCDPDSLLEERIGSAAKLIQYAIAQCGDSEKVTAGVKELSALYQQAAVMDGSN